MKELIETRFGPAEVCVFASGGLSLYFRQNILINKVEYRSVQVWHKVSGTKRSVETMGYGLKHQNLTPAAVTALTTELERLRLTYATAERTQAAARAALESRIERLTKEVQEAEAAWHKAQSELEAACAGLAEHPALDRPAA